MSFAPPIRMVFHLPREPNGAVLIQGKQSPWKLVFATQDQVKHLGPDWEVRGVYLLFGPGEKPENYWVRVGKSAPGTLRKRVPAHTKKGSDIVDCWDHALLICSTVGNGFNSADAGYLEGELANLLSDAPRAELHEGQRDQDDTLELWEIDELEPVIDVVFAVMRVLGYSPDHPETDQAKEASTGASDPGEAPSKFSIGDLIEAGLLAPGDELKSISKQFGEIATVQEDGSIEVEGEIFTAPSSAASKLAGSSTNGWNFWATDTADGRTVRLSDLRNQLNDGDTVQADGTPGSSPSPGFDGPLLPLVSAKLLKAGDNLVATSKGETYRAVVTKDGWVERDGETFTPSAIAKALAGYSVNGWEFWRLDVEGRPKLSTLKEKL